MTLGICHGDRRCFRVQPDYGADTLAQVFVGEADRVTNEELFALRAQWRRRVGVNRGGRAIGNDRRIRYRPAPPAHAVLNDRLCVSKLDDGTLRRRSQRIVPDITDGHSEVQALTYFQNASGVIEHFADCEIEAIQLGAGRLPKRVENVPEGV